MEYRFFNFFRILILGLGLYCSSSSKEPPKLQGAENIKDLLSNLTTYSFDQKQISAVTALEKALSQASSPQKGEIAQALSLFYLGLHTYVAIQENKELIQAVLTKLSLKDDSALKTKTVRILEQAIPHLSDPKTATALKEMLPRLKEPEKEVENWLTQIRKLDPNLKSTIPLYIQFLLTTTKALDPKKETTADQEFLTIENQLNQVLCNLENQPDPGNVLIPDKNCALTCRKSGQSPDTSRVKTCFESLTQDLKPPYTQYDELLKFLLVTSALEKIQKTLAEKKADPLYRLLKDALARISSKRQDQKLTLFYKDLALKDVAIPKSKALVRSSSFNTGFHLIVTKNDDLFIGKRPSFKLIDGRIKTEPATPGDDFQLTRIKAEDRLIPEIKKADELSRKAYPSPLEKGFLINLYLDKAVRLKSLISRFYADINNVTGQGEEKTKAIAELRADLNNITGLSILYQADPKNDLPKDKRALMARKFYTLLTPSAGTIQTVMQILKDPKEREKEKDKRPIVLKHLKEKLDPAIFSEDISKKEAVKKERELKEIETFLVLKDGGVLVIHPAKGIQIETPVPQLKKVLNDLKVPLKSVAINVSYGTTIETLLKITEAVLKQEPAALFALMFIDPPYKVKEKEKEASPIYCNEADIKKVVASRHYGIKWCYENELQRKRDLTGKVTVNWVIDLTGKVTKAFVESSTVNSKTLEQCIVSKVYTWIFEKPKDGKCLVRFPFVLQAK